MLVLCDKRLFINYNMIFYSLKIQPIVKRDDEDEKQASQIPFARCDRSQMLSIWCRHHHSAYTLWGYNFTFIHVACRLDQWHSACVACVCVVFILEFFFSLLSQMLRAVCCPIQLAVIVYVHCVGAIVGHSCVTCESICCIWISIICIHNQKCTVWEPQEGKKYK